MRKVPASKSREKAAVILLTGFLGSGKTTLLKQILSWETDLSDTVVVVNEFGDVGIDGGLLENVGSDVIELNSGCICCTLAADLKQSLDYLWEKFRPGRVLIESSGVADPTAVSSVLMSANLRQTMTLQKVVAVLDGDFWSAREVFGPLFFNQLEMAHLILLNKIDLLDKDQISAYLEEIHEVIPNSQVVPTIHCRVDPETLWTHSEIPPLGIKPMDFFQTGPRLESVDASGYITFSFQTSRYLNEARLKQFINELPFELFRMKGSVCFTDRTVMVNFVGGRCDWSSWSGEEKTKLAFIGWNVRSEILLQKLEDCVDS